MENKILFLIVIIGIGYLLLTSSGQTFIGQLFGGAKPKITVVKNGSVVIDK